MVENSIAAAFRIKNNNHKMIAIVNDVMNDAAKWCYEQLSKQNGGD